MDNELKSKLDALLVQTALNTAHLKTLTFAFDNLAKESLSSQGYSNLFSNYYHTLVLESNSLLKDHDLLFDQSAALRALFELSEYANRKLEGLE